MQEIARVTLNLAALREGHSAGPFSDGLPFGKEAKSDDAAHARLTKLLAMHDRCTVVYLACGSCGPGCAVVEYYCTSGGSQPDHVDRVKC